MGKGSSRLVGDIIESHPTASLIPLLDEDELAALAHDIQENGLLQPIVLDRQGRILDGRGRLAACERAGTEPAFVTFEGDTPDVYVLSVNLRRRSLTKGQSAMITVKARSVSEQGGRSGSEQSARSVSETARRRPGRDGAREHRPAARTRPRRPGDQRRHGPRRGVRRRPAEQGAGRLR
ncbi:ParB N-terminal domain-containing protein [Streptomyces sp. R28]|uniref:ParB N-terminal domain-containing protein n=1 Tax=Streptomyces sp. R28 TaxID=3238628 RepID=A0AB39QES3_9ACTN